MSKSIISNTKECLFCGSTRNLHKHHIYGGARRKMSEHFGCWCYLCGYHHNLSSHGVHTDRVQDQKLKRFCQKKFEETHTRDEFRRYFGSSYLMEDEDES